MRSRAMFNSTGDPVVDAERYQQYLDETCPEREGAVRITLDVWVNVTGCTEEELKESAFLAVKDMMSNAPVSEWDFEFKEVEFDEYS